MNKKGSIFLGVSLGIFIFIMGVLILPYITDDVATFRVALDCANSGSITNGTMITCLFGGAVVPYYIWLFTALALGLVIGGRK
jgi:hypothetical protein